MQKKKARKGFLFLAYGGEVCCAPGRKLLSFHVERK